MFHLRADEGDRRWVHPKVGPESRSYPEEGTGMEATKHSLTVPAQSWSLEELREFCKRAFHSPLCQYA